MATRFIMKDKWTYLLAVGVLIGFFFYFGVALFEGAVFSSPNDYSGIEKVAASMGLLPASIVGYYFGQRPVQSLIEQVEEAIRKGSRARGTAVRMSNNSLPLAIQEIELLNEHLKAREKIIEILIKKTSNQ
jgi:hypothetical protein